LYSPEGDWEEMPADEDFVDEENEKQEEDPMSNIVESP
jgi:hypothetical protein